MGTTKPTRLWATKLCALLCYASCKPLRCLTGIFRIKRTFLSLSTFLLLFLHLFSRSLTFFQIKSGIRRVLVCGSCLSTFFRINHSRCNISLDNLGTSKLYRSLTGFVKLPQILEGVKDLTIDFTPQRYLNEVKNLRQWDAK